MKIAFLGASKYSYEILKFLIKKKFNISIILTSSSELKKSNSGNLKELSGICKIPLIKINNNLNECNAILRSYSPDLILVFGWYSFIPKKIREIAPLGCIGMHASPLPKYSGGSPLVWQIINGEKESAVTLFYLEDGVDTGDIIYRHKFIINKKDDIASVYNKVLVISKKILITYLPRLELKTAPRIKQNLSLRTVYPSRSPRDGRINWRWSAEKIRNFIRAQTKPYPGAFSYIKGKKIIIWKAKIDSKKTKCNFAPGKIYEVGNNSFSAVTGDMALKIIEWDSKIKINKKESLKLT
jgi:methionyl-tRNA formyltransferase